MKLTAYCDRMFQYFLSIFFFLFCLLDFFFFLVLFLCLSHSSRGPFKISIENNIVYYIKGFSQFNSLNGRCYIKSHRFIGKWFFDRILNLIYFSMFMCCFVFLFFFIVAEIIFGISTRIMYLILFFVVFVLISYLFSFFRTHFFLRKNKIHFFKKNSLNCSSGFCVLIRSSPLCLYRWIDTIFLFCVRYIADLLTTWVSVFFLFIWNWRIIEITRNSFWFSRNSLFFLSLSLFLDSLFFFLLILFHFTPLIQQMQCGFENGQSW